MPETTILHKPGVRRFTHVQGFLDTTQFVDLYPNGDVYLVYKDKQAKSIAFDKSEVLSYLDSGQWKEIPYPDDKRELTFRDFEREFDKERARHQLAIKILQEHLVKFQETCKHSKTRRFSKYYSYCLTCDKPLKK